MHPRLRSAGRWAAWGLGALAALGVAFVFGLALGHASATDPPQKPSADSVLDDAANQISSDGLHPVDRGALDAAAIKAMLAAADDEWGSWGDGSSSEGSYTGVGLSLRRSGSALVVSQVAAGGPADNAEVQVGDVLEAVDGRDVSGLTPAQAADLLRGRPGSTVVLALQLGRSTRTISLTRAVLASPRVRATMITSSVGCIVIPAFTAGVGREVRDAVATLRRAHATGLVLDLRGDPGGLLSEAVETASAFLDGGTVVTYARRDEAPQALDADAKGGDTVTPLVVLVDGGTASAAEVVAGALQDRGRAVVVGTRTFGKGTVQEPHALPDGSSLVITVARYTLPSGRSVDGVGIEPDIHVSDPRAAVARAVEVLSGLLADNGSGRG